MDFIKAILAAIAAIFGVLPKAATPEEKAEKTGESAGETKAGEQNAVAAVNELERAQQGSADAHAAVAADPDLLRRDDNPSVRPYRPGSAD